MERVGGTQRIKVDVRVIAATNKDLTGEIRAGRFREDLYFRLNVVPLFVPALRDRQGDIPMLAEHFIAMFAAEAGKRPKRLAPEAAARLQQYNWPGNVRELQNVIARLLIFVAGDTITAQDLGFLAATVWCQNRRRSRRRSRRCPGARSSKDYILRTLAAQQGNGVPPPKCWAGGRIFTRSSRVRHYAPGGPACSRGPAPEKPSSCR